MAVLPEDLESFARLLVADERKRQIEKEGWTAEHDAWHGAQVLAKAAHAYRTNQSSEWPWDLQWWKPKGRLRNLIRAGALYQAAADVSPVPPEVDFGPERPRTAPATRVDYEYMRDVTIRDLADLLIEAAAVFDRAADLLGAGTEETA